MGRQRERSAAFRNQKLQTTDSEELLEDLSSDGSFVDCLESGSDGMNICSGDDQTQAEFLTRQEPKYDVFVEGRHPTEKYKGKRRAVPEEEIEGKKFKAISMDLEFEDKIDKRRVKHKSVHDEVKQLESENIQILATLAKSQHSDVQKGAELKQQFAVGKSIASLLLKLHDPLKKLNSFPAIDDFNLFSGNVEKVAEMYKSLFHCIYNRFLISSKFNGFLLENPSFDSERLWQQIENHNSACLERSLEDLDVWTSKLSHAQMGDSKLKSKQLKVINQSLSQQLGMAMKDEPRLIKKTQINREKVVLLTNGQIPIESASIYDDTDLYLALLKEVDNLQAGSLNDPEKVAIRINALKKAKVKKHIDTKASKGRKIKYVLLEKLANFMAPCTPNSQSRWSDEKKDEFFCSLFGNIPQTIEVEQ